MSLEFAGYAIAVLGALAIMGIGIGYVLWPFSMAPSFGLPNYPTPSHAGWLNLKGVRDITSGLVLLVPVMAGNERLLAIMMAIASVTPLGDAANILLHGGSRTAAFSIHGLTAALILVGALCLAIG